MHNKDQSKDYPKSLFVFLSILLIYPFTPVDIFGDHEIYPWYFVILALVFHRPGVFIAFGLSVAAITLLTYGLTELGLFKKEAVLDLAQVVVVFASLYYLNNLPKGFLLEIDKWMRKMLIIVVVLMLLQMMFPLYLDVLSDLLTFRQHGYTIDYRSGGVRGVAPEPAYMAAIVVSVYMYSWWVNNRIKGGMFLLCSLAILLTGSLSGMFIFLIVIFLSVVNLKDLMYGRHISIIAAVLVLVSVAAIFTDQATDRFLHFLDRFMERLLAFDIEEILLLEGQYGSSRVSTLIDPYLKFTPGYVFTGEYNKAYSFFGVLTNLFSPLSWLLALYYLMRKKLTRIRLTSLFLMLFYGPIMFVLLYVGLLKKVDNSTVT